MNFSSTRRPIEARRQGKFLSAVPASPLYVDLDGTLIATDLLPESVLRLLQSSPAVLLQLPLWLWHGKAFMKRRIAERIHLDASSLPYRPSVLDVIRNARAQGRRVVLATASDELLASSVARHLGVFDGVLASDGQSNLAGSRKLRAIEADAAGQPFGYVGNDRVDLAVWRGAQEAIVVSSSAALRRDVEQLTRVQAQIDVPRATLGEFLHSIRVHQWLKNLIVFIPLLPILGETSLKMLGQAIAMFVAFSLCASAVYLFNDLLDLENDRHHPRKRNRALAAGVIPVHVGIGIAFALLLGAAAVAIAWLPWLALGVLGGYLVLTTAYSTWLKRKMLVDVFALAALYAARVLAGAAAVSVAPSFWLLGFSMFIFLSLALAKRYVEITELPDGGRVRGRDYTTADSLFVVATGICAGQLSILTLSLYLNDPIVVKRYAHPYLLWMLCPLLLYWLIRVWLKAHRGELHHDPVVFAASDGISRTIVLACLALIVAAS